MTFWNLYFILKLYLFATGHLNPLWLVNIGFLAALALTNPVRHRGLRAVRFLVGLAIGVPLIYHEAFIPPFSRVIEEAKGLESFTAGYWFELAGRYLPPVLLVTVAAVIVGHWLVNRWLRVATFIAAALIVLPLWHTVNLVVASVQSASAAGVRKTGVVEQPLDHNAALAAFRTAESQREVSFGKLSNDPKEQFDIIILHICSLSWDDLDVAKARDNPMLSHFDYLLTNFSTAASYSGPAAMSCGRAVGRKRMQTSISRPRSNAICCTISRKPGSRRRS